MVHLHAIGYGKAHGCVLVREFCVVLSVSSHVSPVTLRTLAIGAAGGFVPGIVGMPGGWIAGSMLAVAVATLSGVSVNLPRRLREIGFLLVGISMGSGVTPETLAQLPSWPITITLVVISIPVIAGAVSYFLLRVARWNRATAFLASMPGALSYLMAIAPDTDANVPRVAILQTTRVAILVAILPVVALMLTEETAPAPIPPLGGFDDAINLFAAGIGGGILAALLKVPGGLLVGALFSSALLHATSLVEGRPPEWVAVVGFVTLGILIGTRFAGTRWSDLGQILGVSLVGFALSIALALVMALIGAAITDFSLLKLIVAFAPGGLEAMVVLAFAMNLDPAFVAAHHLVRFLLIALTLPFLVRWFGLIRAPR